MTEFVEFDEAAVQRAVDQAVAQVRAEYAKNNAYEASVQEGPASARRKKRWAPAATDRWQLISQAGQTVFFSERVDLLYGTALTSPTVKFLFDKTGAVYLTDKTFGGNPAPGLPDNVKKAWFRIHDGNRRNQLFSVLDPLDPLNTTSNLLRRGESLSSLNGLYQLKFENDGNIILYGVNDHIDWQTNTSGTSAASILYVSDFGFLSLIDDEDGDWFFDSGVNKGGGTARVVLENTGLLTTYFTSGATEVKTWDQVHGRFRNQLFEVDTARVSGGGFDDWNVLWKGEKLFSLNDVYQLHLQMDGNLVLSVVSTGVILWQSDTAGSAASEDLLFYISGADGLSAGRLILADHYNSSNYTEVWTNGNARSLAQKTAPCRVVLEDSGNLIAYFTGSGVEAIWDSGNLS